MSSLKLTFYVLLICMFSLLAYSFTSPDLHLMLPPSPRAWFFACWLGADSFFAGTDDHCRARGRSHSNSHHGSLGAVDCRSHRCNGVWGVAHLPSRHRHRAHPFSCPADSIGQKLSPAHHHSYHQCHRQKDLALEIVEYKGGTNMAKITKEQYEFALSHRSPVDICRADE